MSAESPGADTPARLSLRDLPAYFAVAAVIFIVLLPTLPWQQFGGDSEDLIVQPVLEMRHGGPWWIPTLEGQPRIRKPPLPTWIAAAAARPNTVAKLSSPIPSQRESAYRALAFEVRWPALLAACLTLVAVGLTGQILAGRTVGILSAVFCGTTLLFLQSSREATTDPYLALFVAYSNLFLGLAIFERRYWLGLPLAGIALGLAFMSKGPVCLLQTVVPVVIYLAARGQRNAPPLRTWLAPLIAGLFLLAAIALPWWVSVMSHVPAALDTFGTELAGEGAKNISHDPFFAYLMLIPLMTPWMGFFLLGWRGLKGRRIVLAAFLVLVPLLILTLPIFRDKKPRYLVPTLGPAAILAAYGATSLVKSKSTRTTYESIMLNFQWGTLLVVAVGVPVFGMYAWNSVGASLASAVVGVALIGLAIRVEGRGPFPAAFLCAAAMILPALLALHGLLNSSENLSEMKPVAEGLKQYLLVQGGRAAYFEPPSNIGKPVTLDLDIYLDQPVPILHDVSELSGPNRPAAVVMMVRENPTTVIPPETTPQLPGWLPIFNVRSGKHPYHFWVLVPVASGAAANASIHRGG